MASAAATEATLYDVDMPQHQHQLDPRHDNGSATVGQELADDQLLDAAGTNPDEDEDRQSYPLGQSHTPLTSIPTLGQALIDGNNIDRKYVHSFLQVLADHSQFSDKYQHYVEDEYERKRKRKLRESERKMFFYAGQSASGGSGDKSKRKPSSADKGAGSSTSNKKRRRKERERERERVLDKDSRRQLSGSAPLMTSMALGSSLDSASSRSSSPFNSPPTAGLSAERAGSMPNMPWSASSDRNAFYSTSVPSGMPAHPAQDIHQMSSVQAASQLMRPRASMPHLPTQQYHPRGHSSVGAYPLHQSASAHFSPSSSYDFMSQPSPLSSSSSSASFASSYHFTSPAPSPASHIVPIKATDYAPSPPTYHHPLHHQQQHHQQQSYASYYQPQPQPPVQRYHQQPLLANSMPAEMLLEAYGGHFTAEEQPNDTPLDETWTSSSSISSSMSSSEISGSESFSCSASHLTPTNRIRGWSSPRLRYSATAVS